jgi:ribonuclease BN (tRNA processing enzyme)
MSSVSVIVLGAGDAFASRGLFQAAYVIKAGGARILMEAGPSLLASMKRCAISPGDIDLVLISHMHGDHYGGLPFLILEYMYETRLRKKLVIAGPRRLEQRTWTLFRNLYPESDTSKVARKLKFVVLEPGKTAKLGRFKISTLRTPHMVKEVSLAFRIEAAGKAIVFTGDTGWTEELIPFSAGADLFLTECTLFRTRSDSHLSYQRIAANRERFSARRIVLTHLGREVLERIREVEIETASDGMTIDL